ncbi:YafY family transcriptional regulator [Streptomyces sp. NBC_00133]|uniref:helix-turn-helix transcriptional regulator n=1 Tax=Streptomyces sp. NBC_00133 TaxID=2903624 RepID=UPI003255308B
MKSDRLLSILLLLQTRGLVPAAELAERLEVSVRTIYRDIESLSASGVPVYAERGRHGGIALLPGFRTDVTGLTADESRALFVLAAQGAHSALGLDEALGSALRKVMAALPEPHRPAAELTSRRILVDPARWMRGTQPAVDLDVLNSAVFTDRRLRLRYRHSGTTEPRTYTLDPYGLVVKAGVWYLVADHRAAPRLFRADRVLAATLTDAPVRRRAGQELADVWEVLRRQVEDRPADVRVTVRVRADRLDLFLRIQASQLAAEPVPAGEWAHVELALASTMAARALLAFGESVEVLSPPEAREELAQAAAAVVELYGNRAPGPADAGVRVPRPADGGEGDRVRGPAGGGEGVRAVSPASGGGPG